MKKVVRIIDGQRVEGVLLNTHRPAKQPTVRPRPQKPVFGSRIPKKLEREEQS